MYGGLVTLAAGVVLTIHPIPRIGVPSRARGALVMAGALTLAVAGMWLPASLHRAEATRTRIDDFIPAWQFNEVHTLHVDALPEHVWDATRAVTAGEIRLFQLLTTIRRFGRRGPESILNAPDQLPILDVATRTTFLALALEPPRELVLGTFVIAPPGFRRSHVNAEGFAGYNAPGIAKAAMNFTVEPDGRGGSNLRTETRVFATDAGATRAFARYWRLIYPGSALIRYEWLRAIARRATHGAPT